MPRNMRRWIGITTLLLGLALAFVSGIRTLHAYRMAKLVASGQVQVEALRGWMTLPYVAKVFGVPEADLREAIGAPAQGDDHRSLQSWFLHLQLDPLAGRQRLEQVILAGDAGAYMLGRVGIGLVPAGLLQSAAWQRAIGLFARWGGWSVFLTRFALTPAALPVSLLAGSTGYAMFRFMAAVVAGEAIWVLLFAGLGRLFADRWEQVSEISADLLALIAGLAMVVVGGLLARARRR